MSKAVYAVWDSETTGIEVHKDRIVQWFMGTADEEGNLIDTWEWFIYPGVEVPPEASDIHGFTTEWLRENGRQPQEALCEIRQVFLDHLDLTHIAFNMAFDMTILDAEFKRHGISDNFGTFMADNVRLVDGLVIDRAKDRYRRGKRNLATQAKHYGVDYDPGELHNARADVELTARVTVKILEKFGVPTTREQKTWYADWAEGFQDYLRRTDPDAVVNGEWPLKTE